MGPISLLRGFGLDMEAGRDRLSEGATRVSAQMAQARERVIGLAQTARPALGTLRGAPRRVWMAERTGTICVIGGFIAAPLLTMLAWAGLLLPATTPLHGGAEALFVVAIILLGLALVSAHTQLDRTGSDGE